MIWTENWGQRPAGNQVGTTTIGGQHLPGVAVRLRRWRHHHLPVDDPADLGHDAAGLFFADVRARGWTPTTTWQVDYGVEVVDTNGNPERFDFTDFSITD